MVKKEIYSRSIGELLREVCSEIIKCNKMINEIEWQQKKKKKKKGKKNKKRKQQQAIYGFAYEQAQQRMWHLNQIGETLDELVSQYEEMIDENYIYEDMDNEE